MRGVLITGGCGFIGTNLAHAVASSGRRVRLLDNLSRAGVEKNLQWLRDTHGDRISVEIADVRDAKAVRRAMIGVETVFHFAAQVAVTTSLDDPGHDFEVNARGTLNVLEAVRAQDDPPALLFTSTNKVYGGMDDVPLRLRPGLPRRLAHRRPALLRLRLPQIRGGDRMASACKCAARRAQPLQLAGRSRGGGRAHRGGRTPCFVGPRPLTPSPVTGRGGMKEREA